MECSFDLENLSNMMRHVSHEFIGSAQILDGERCTASEIKKALTAIKADRDDTIFVFYSGHGAYDSKGHFLDIDKRLYRRDIAKNLKQQNTRLTVFISDACNGFKGDDPESIGTPVSGVEFSTSNLTKMESFLLNYRGAIDLNCADKNQGGWSNAEVGGFFAFQFSKYFTSRNDNPKDWEQAINTIASRCNAYYKEIRKEAISRNDASPAMENQLELTPKVFQFKVQPSPSGIQVGQRTFRNVKPVRKQSR